MARNLLEPYKKKPCSGGDKHHPYATKPYSQKDWQEMKKWPLEKKIKWSRKKLYVELHKADSPVVSFSGGKSSEVALHLASNFGSLADPNVVYNETGVSYPETRPFVKELAEEWGFDLTITEPRKTFWDCVEEYGWPETRTSGATEPRCCYWLKMEPMRRFIKENKIDLFITGEQASESMQRRVNLLLYGATFKYRKWNWKNHNLRKAKPVAIWTDEDIWGYIDRENLPVNPAYEKYGIDRTGCFTCTGFGGWEKKMSEFSFTLYRRAKKEKDSAMLIEDFGEKGADG